MKPKPNRLSNNLAILNRLENFFRENPDIRFFQGLQILKIQESRLIDDGLFIKSNFYEESEKTLDKLIKYDSIKE